MSGRRLRRVRARRLTRFVLLLVVPSAATAQADSARPRIASGSGAVSVAERIRRVEAGLLPAVTFDGQPWRGMTLTARMRHHRTPGVSVAVINDGRIEWARGYGYADMERRRPVDTTTLFQAASVSKPVAAVAALENEQDILDVNLDSPEAVAPMVAGVAGDFALAYSDAAVIGGLYGGELIHTGSFPTWREVETGFGKRPSGTGNQLYSEFARAMWVADTAAVRIEKALEKPDASAEVADVLIYGAFAHFLMADHFCEATVKGGPAITPDSLYKRAEAIFTRALAVATAANKPDLRNRATAGRARARLMLKNYAGARDDAKLIPGSFRFNAVYSANSARENNTVATQTTTLTRREAGVNPRFYNDPAFKADPRTPFRDRGDTARGPDPLRKFVEQLKYPVRESPIAISSWQEARLVEAESEAQLGNTARAVTLINEVRAAAALAPYAGGTAAGVLDQLYYERSAELWLQGQSLNDLRRFNHPFLATRLDKCFEIGQLEWDNNPNLGARP